MYNHTLLELPVADYRHRRANTSTSAVHSLYLTNTLDYVANYAALKARWESSTKFLSSLDEMVEADAMQSIIALGDLAVPLIVTDLKATPSFLYLALPEIYGFDPLPDSLNGDLAGLCRAWVEWIERQRVVAG